MEEYTYLIQHSRLTDENRQIRFNFCLNDADITRLNNSKIIEIVHIVTLQNLTVLKYRTLPFFELSKLQLVLNEFITFKSRTN
jgi:hypothetical protein